MEINYKEFDFEGEETLKAISLADDFNRWVYETIRPFCQGKILEIGSGIGNISQFFIRENADLTLSDIREQYRKYLRDATSSNNVLNIDIVHPAFESEYINYVGTFDTVFALNVVEHVEDDSLALRNMSLLLKPGGNVVILVPSYQFLYNEFDRQLYHYRRYTLKSLLKIVPEGSKVIEKKYFNFCGIFGWFVAGGILRKKTIPEGNMRLYNKLMPLIRVVDKLVLNEAGLSSIVVFRRQ